ncbi:hypothetical protein ANCCEY_03458 [Ancylostoma ceylanicum]|uniref:Uncharacterized protein n=1 Tax=Ancylostoma ceylanicum TaxID=53326 RepID=A0A0D6LZL3_9BILA|nr:hypothetical protein ANCCEY_03458 [Ancylostoma ceylanicum]
MSEFPEHLQIVRYRDEDENWAKKAIDNLMKKLLKHNKDALASLEFALQTRVQAPKMPLRSIDEIQTFQLHSSMVRSPLGHVASALTK